MKALKLIRLLSKLPPNTDIRVEDWGEDYRNPTDIEDNLEPLCFDGQYELKYKLDCEEKKNARQ